MRRKQRRYKNPVHLSGQFWDSVGQAFTDPEKRFEFPIKPFEMDFTQESKNTMYLTAGILGMSAIVVALIVNKK